LYITPFFSHHGHSFQNIILLFKQPTQQTSGINKKCAFPDTKWMATGNSEEWMSQKPKYSKKTMKLNWKCRRGGGKA